MTSKGFTFSWERYGVYIDEQYSLGHDTIYTQLVHFHPSLKIHTLLKDVARIDPILSSKFPLVAAAGYTEGILIHELRGGTHDIKKNVGLCAGLFNMCIGLFDYVVDELKLGKEIFRIISHKFLINLLSLSSTHISLRKTDARDKRIDLLIRLMIAFSKLCKILHRQTKNNKTWKGLVLSILKLYNAEKISFLLQGGINLGLTRNQLIDVLTYKSAGSSLIKYFISKLGLSSSLQERIIKKICYMIGNIFGLADDLADIIKDQNSGNSNSINLELLKADFETIHVIPHETFYKALILAIEKLLNELIRLKYNIRRISVSSNVYYRIIEFVQMNIASWLLPY